LFPNKALAILTMHESKVATLTRFNNVAGVVVLSDCALDHLFSISADNLLRISNAAERVNVTISSEFNEDIDNKLIANATLVCVLPDPGSA
jgi:hypothetical protein